MTFLPTTAPLSLHETGTQQTQEAMLSREANLRKNGRQAPPRADKNQALVRNPGQDLPLAANALPSGTSLMVLLLGPDGAKHPSHVARQCGGNHSASTARALPHTLPRTINACISAAKPPYYPQTVSKSAVIKATLCDRLPLLSQLLCTLGLKCVALQNPVATRNMVNCRVAVVPRCYAAAAVLSGERCLCTPRLGGRTSSANGALTLHLKQRSSAKDACVLDQPLHAEPARCLYGIHPANDVALAALSEGRGGRLGCRVGAAPASGLAAPSLSVGNPTLPTVRVCVTLVRQSY